MNVSDQTYRSIFQEGIASGGPFQLPEDIKKALLKVVIYDPRNDTLGSRLIEIN